MKNIACFNKKTFPPTFITHRGKYQSARPPSLVADEENNQYSYPMRNLNNAVCGES